MEYNYIPKFKLSGTFGFGVSNVKDGTIHILTYFLKQVA